jgi:hypothetical protein
MKLLKRLVVNGAEYPLVSDEVRLDISRPGAAIFQVRADQRLEGRVEFSLGWHFQSALTRFFCGEVVTSTTVDAKQQRLFCRELSARMDNAAPLSLRHPTLREVLATYAELTGLEFIVPERPYAFAKVPAFYGFGSAMHAMQTLGEVFHIDDYVWLSQGDGKIFVGSWADSRWKGREVEIPQNVFKQVSAGGQCTMAAVPDIRPGCVVNAATDGGRVETVTLSGVNMSFKCKTF